jgi:hypothetical protein
MAMVPFWSMATENGWTVESPKNGRDAWIVLTDGVERVIPADKSREPKRN